MHQKSDKTQVMKQRELTILYKRVFGSEDGQKVLYNLMRNHFVLQPTLIKSDPIVMSFNEGARNVVLRIMTLMKMDLERFDKLITEGENDDNY